MLHQDFQSLGFCNLKNNNLYYITLSAAAVYFCVGVLSSIHLFSSFFLGGAYIEKRGMVFWGESNKEVFIFIIIIFVMAVTFL